MREKLYNVGVYIRLSKESIAYSGEDSLSIENQQAMLSKFIAMMPGWIEQKVYIDDGATGGNFDRKGFQEMMTDVRGGMINLVLVQDLSRFGRNYLESGRYLEEELPDLGCRFVSISDGIDTETGENDIMPFLNAMNDFHLKNLSDRIKSVFQAKAKSGHKLTGAAPYGYMRNPDDHTMLIVDESAANVIKKIFDLRAGGFGYGKIVEVLNREGVAPPRLHNCLRQNREPGKSCGKMWIISAIVRIVRDEIYLGHTTSCKFGRSYRNKKVKHKDESEWVKTLNTHTAIINVETWDKAQEVNARLTKWTENARERQQALFSGKIVCADCNTNMMFHSETRYTSKKNLNKLKNDNRRNSYLCKSYHVTGRQKCTRHNLGEDALKEIVLENIKRHAKQIRFDEDRALRKLYEKLIVGYSLDKVELAKELQDLKQERHKIDVQTEQLYEDKITGIITTKTFANLTEKTELRRMEVESRITAVEQSAKASKIKQEDIQNWVRLVKEKSTLKDVDRELLETLIERAVWLSKNTPLRSVCFAKQNAKISAVQKTDTHKNHQHPEKIYT